MQNLYVPPWASVTKPPTAASTRTPQAMAAFYEDFFDDVLTQMQAIGRVMTMQVRHHQVLSVRLCGAATQP